MAKDVLSVFGHFAWQLVKRTVALAASVVLASSTAMLLFLFLSSHNSTAYTTNVVSAPPLRQVAQFILPAGYSTSNEYPLLVYHHGAGQNHASTLTEPLNTNLIVSIVNAGWIVASSDAHLENWGNQNSVDDMEEVIAYALTNYSVKRKGVVIMSQSMGGLDGLVTLTNRASGVNTNIVGWVGVYPVCSLSNMFFHSIYTADIRTAYGIAGDNSDYDSKTDGHDPVNQLPGSAYAGLRMRWYASPSDTVVTKVANTDAMRAKVAPYVLENELIVCSGDHGDPSHFQPADTIPFLNRNLSYWVTTNGSDSNPGSQDRPWATIDKAITSAQSGATIYVGQGHYKTNAVDFNPIRFTTPSQTFMFSNGVYLGQVFVESTNVTLKALTNTFTIGENFYGGFSSDPAMWFKAGSDGSVLDGGRVISQNGQDQFGIRFDATNCVAQNCDMPGPWWKGIFVQFAGASNQFVNSFIHDAASPEAAFYIWGYYNRIASCTLSNLQEAGLPGAHPDLVQSFFAASWGTLIESNRFVNNSCQIGSLQSANADAGDPYNNNPDAGGWVFRRNLFINSGSKLDVDFRDMQFVNNTFYNCNNNTAEGHCINFNYSPYGKGTNGVMINNLFVIVGANPASTNQGWFSVDEGTNTQNIIRNSLTSSNNFVVGDQFGSKNPALLYGGGWVNGGNPYLVSAPASRDTNNPIPDLHLMKQSSAIGAGLGGVDIGAYQWDSNQLVWITFGGWPGQSNCVDVTGYTNHGYVFGGSTNWPTLAVGPFSATNAAHIGDNQYFAVTNAANTFGHLTNGAIAIWVKPDAGFEAGSVNYGYMLDIGFSFPESYGFTLGHDPANATKFYGYNSGGTRFTILEFPDYGATNWHHYAVAWDATNAVGYFDGSPFQTNATSVPFFQVDSAGWMAIGTMQHDGTPQWGDDSYPNAAFLNGSVSDVRVYNRTISGGEAQSLFLGRDVASGGGGSSPVTQTCSRSSTNTTSFTNVYESTMTLTLTAPPTSGGRFFNSWLQDGSLSTTNRSVIVDLSSDKTMTAVFTNIPPAVVHPRVRRR